MKQKKKQRTWTFQPAPDVFLMVQRAIADAEYECKRAGRSLSELDGLRTKICNESLRARYARLAGKRDPQPK